MTAIERQIQNWILQSVESYEQGANGNAMPDFALRQSIRTAHPGVAFADGDLKSHIAASQVNNFITGNTDPVDGVMWNLTARGKNRLNQIR